MRNPRHHCRTRRGRGAGGCWGAVPAPRDEPMPTEVPTSPARTWLAGCIVHHDLPAGAPEAAVKINGRPFLALLDSGSAVSLVQSRILAPRGETKASLPITCMHGDTRHVSDNLGCPWRLAGGSGVVKDLPVPVLIGRDWPGFDRLLSQYSLSAPEGAAVEKAGERNPPILGQRERW